MFKLSRDDLHHKTDAELADLFNRAVRETGKASLTAAFAEAASALRLIRIELTRRGLRLG
ncbi:hypothetical protein [Sphingomonas sp. MM-1]|uniref:hypothetical protein n=1 Tax=Sphingomonas sp. MM-1 TaxID=745310 RepID=UPI000A933971|nr:hypothetical protein [Sphingomonas sp. MM-1]